MLTYTTTIRQLFANRCRVTSFKSAAERGLIFVLISGMFAAKPWHWTRWRLRSKSASRHVLFVIRYVRLGNHAVKNKKKKVRKVGRQLQIKLHTKSRGTNCVSRLIGGMLTLSARQSPIFMTIFMTNSMTAVFSSNACEIDIRRQRSSALTISSKRNSLPVMMSVGRRFRFASLVMRRYSAVKMRETWASSRRQRSDAPTHHQMAHVRILPDGQQLVRSKRTYGGNSFYVSSRRQYRTPWQMAWRLHACHCMKSVPAHNTFVSWLLSCDEKLIFFLQSQLC